MANPFEELEKRLNNIEVFLVNLGGSIEELEKRLNNIEVFLVNLGGSIEKIIEQKNRPERFLNKKEAAELLGVSVSTIDNYRRSKKIKSYKIENVVRFKRSELEKQLVLETI